MEMSGQLHVLAALPPDEEPLLPIRNGEIWTPELVLMLSKKVNIFSLPGIEP
jgi:hypothetical protein